MYLLVAQKAPWVEVDVPFVIHVLQGLWPVAGDGFLHEDSLKLIQVFRGGRCKEVTGRTTINDAFFQVYAFDMREQAMPNTVWT